MKQILIVEDDIKISRYLQLELQHAGYLTDTAFDGEEALLKFKNNFYTLILLDLMLPKLSGESVCKIIRESSNIPIIILTAKDKIFSKVSLLDIGADDYLTKPFIIEELFARIRVIFRNKGNFSSSSFIIFSNIKIDLDEKKVFIENIETKLSKTEYNLLHYLMLNHDITLTREQIISNVWGYDYLGNEKIVDVYIKYLRDKIEPFANCTINTIRGFGYILNNKGDKI